MVVKYMVLRITGRWWTPHITNQQHKQREPIADADAQIPLTVTFGSFYCESR